MLERADAGTTSRNPASIDKQKLKRMMTATPKNKSRQYEMLLNDLQLLRFDIERY